MSEQSSQQVHQMKFAEEHIEPILKGEKTATIRLESSDSFWIGETIHLCNEDGERFASATVSDTGYQSAYWIPKLGVDGHRDYEDVEEFLEEMRGYYPNAHLTSRTCFALVYWEGIWE